MGDLLYGASGSRQAQREERRRYFDRIWNWGQLNSTPSVPESSKTGTLQTRPRYVWNAVAVATSFEVWSNLPTPPATLPAVQKQCSLPILSFSFCTFSWSVWLV